MSKWQLIETAPKDGTWILAYGPYGWEDYSREPPGWAVVYWEKRKWENDIAGRWRLVNANPYDDFMEPTHWMPLPEPPRELIRREQ